jgi:hypothetical protein
LSRRPSSTANLYHVNTGVVTRALGSQGVEDKWERPGSG